MQKIRVFGLVICISVFMVVVYLDEGSINSIKIGIPVHMIIVLIAISSTFVKSK